MGKMAQVKTAGPAPVAGAKKETVKGLEVQLSILETTDGLHTKHVKVHVTDPKVCAAIVEQIEATGADLAEAADTDLIEISE